MCFTRGKSVNVSGARAKKHKWAVYNTSGTGQKMNVCLGTKVSPGVCFV